VYFGRTPIPLKEVNDDPNRKSPGLRTTKPPIPGGLFSSRFLDADKAITSHQTVVFKVFNRRDRHVGDMSVGVERQQQVRCWTPSGSA
jgi:hypothetical protein